MSKERELLKRAKLLMECSDLIEGTLIESKSPALIKDIEEILSQPEPFNPDWVNYQQGVEDATRKPLSELEIQDALIRCRQSTTWDYGFEAGVKFAEQQHKIGVDDE